VDTHLHTNYSLDAYVFNNRTADPDVAYRYAKGLPVIHPYHLARVQIDTPMDFLVVADYAELMGIMKSLDEGDEVLAKLPVAKRFQQLFKDGKAAEVYGEIVHYVIAAERHNDPGNCTTFLG
jgi:hypothetical protein